MLLLLVDLIKKKLIVVSAVLRIETIELVEQTLIF